MSNISENPPPDHSQSDPPAKSAPKRRARTRAVTHSKADPKPDSKPWIIRVSYEVSREAFAKCSNNVFRLAYHFEGIARFTPFVWVDNPTLEKLMGIGDRGLAKLLATAREEGCIEPVHDGTRANLRLGIILLRRLDPELAVADTPERLEVVRHHVLDRWRPTKGLDEQRYWAVRLGLAIAAPGTKARFVTPELECGVTPNLSAELPRTGIRGAPRTGVRRAPRTEVPQKYDRVVKEAEFEERLSASPSRHDLAASLPADVIKFEPSTPLPPPVVLDPLLGRLLPEQIAAYGRADTETRARVLVLLARGDLPARKSAGRLLERFAAAPANPLTFPIAQSPPAQPLSFEELVRAIAATGDQLLVGNFADRCATHFGTVKDQRLFAQFRKVGEAIALGTYDPDEVVRVARSAFTPGVRNAGAYFWRSLRNTLTDGTDSKAV